MAAIVWFGAGAVVAGLLMAWWVLSGDRGQPANPAAQLVEQQPTLRQAELRRSAGERLALPLARAVGGQLGRFTPAGWVGSRSTALARAGLTGRVSPEQLLGGKILLPFLVGAAVLFWTGFRLSALTILLTAAVMLLGFFLPDLLVRAAADRRAESIQADLPDVLDQMTIAVEAGLAFESALARVAEADDNPLAQEFGRMLQDIQLGASRLNALDALGRRVQIEDMRNVVVTLRQADSLGVPISVTLRNLSADMREKRRYRAEEAANGLPVKMVFPLGLCILPALFVVILGPAVIRYFVVFG